MLRMKVSDAVADCPTMIPTGDSRQLRMIPIVRFDSDKV